jgi:type VII secretion protein EccB
VWTERDQIQAYQFLRRRLVSALATGDANHPVSPSRRLVLGTVMGAVTAVLVAAAFGVLGLLKPTGAVDWHQSGQVILEDGTGAHFVLGSDGLLHPVINESSALLLAGADKTVTASASALNSAPRGATLGIPGAPDSLPSAGGLLTPTLVTCSSVSAGQVAAVAPTSSVLLAGPGSATGALAGMRVLSAGQGLLVQVPGSAAYLVAGGYQYQLPAAAVVVALGYQNIAPLPVAPNWLSTLPAGRDLDLVGVPGAGSAGPAVGGAATRVGQVLSTNGALGGAADYYLVRASGLEPITQTEAVLVLGDTANAAAYPGAAPRVLQSSLAAVASAPQYAAGDDAAGYPARIPAPVDAGVGTVVVCASGDGRDVAAVAVGQALPLPPGARAISTGATSGDAVAGQVYVPPGSGALVAAQAAPGAATAVTYLVTDEGIKFRVATAAARSSLGYGSVTPVPVSTTLLNLLPTGPVLDLAAARAVIGVGGGG